MTIAENISEVMQNIEAAKQKAGRTDDVELVVVTKKATIEQTIEAIKAGARIIAENRVQLAAEKFPKLPDVEKHMIGHLQTNKVKHAVKLFDCIQSVDSLKLAKEINRRTENVMPVMIEVNLSGEDQRYGIALSDAENFYNQLLQFTKLKVIGVMGMAPVVDKDETRPYFRALKKLQYELGLPKISMGMSNDYEIAVEEGSNMIRVGTKIFSN